MEITRSSIETVKGPEEWFTGDVYIDPSPRHPLPRGCRPTSSTSPRAPPPRGTRTHSDRPSTSPRASAYARKRGGAIEVIGPGDRVLFEPDEDHWHGAAPNRFMVHLALNEVDDDHTAANWGDKVTDDEYSAAPTTRR